MLSIISSIGQDGGGILSILYRWGPLTQLVHFVLSQIPWLFRFPPFLRFFPSFILSRQCCAPFFHLYFLSPSTMFTTIAALSLLLFGAANALNDWSVPCTDGTCSWDLENPANRGKGTATGTLQVVSGSS